MDKKEKKPFSLTSWLAEMPLSQQLFTLILITILISGIFYVAYLRQSASVVISSENYALLERMQRQMIRLYQQDPELLYNPALQEEDISHLIWNGNEAEVYIGSFEPTENYYDLYARATASTLKDHEGQLEIDETVCYYRLGTISGDIRILSIVSASSSRELSDYVFNNLTNVTAIFILFIAAVLVYWSSTLISPLNQIKNYIDKVRAGEKAQLNIDRADEIGEVADAVQNMYEELQRQDQVKEEMIHNISHDLKTPIATIRSYAESIQDGIYPYGSLESSVDVIIENANRLDSRVHSLLFLNRLDYLLNSSERQMNSINMNQIVSQVQRSFSAMRPEVTITVSDEPTVFRGEEESWRILVENLMDNAMRYANSSVVVELHPGYLSVFNDGQKISAQQMSRLFRPFEKGDNGKFGLGLSICSKVAEAYGYSIRAENQEDGVLFRVADKSPAEEKKPKKRERQHLRKGKKGKDEAS